MALLGYYHYYLPIYFLFSCPTFALACKPISRGLPKLRNRKLTQIQRIAGGGYVINNNPQILSGSGPLYAVRIDLSRRCEIRRMAAVLCGAVPTTVPTLSRKVPYRLLS